MKRKSRYKILIVSVLSLVIACSSVCNVKAEDSEEPEPPKKFIKWMSFDIPDEALDKAMNLDIKSHEKGPQINWIDLLSCLGSKYGGNWKRYRSKDMDSLIGKLKNGQSMDSIAEKYKNYNFFHETYSAVLSNFVGEYQLEVPSEEEKQTVMKTKYGLKAFSPIAKGYSYSHYDDFGDSRSFGFKRRHLGNDLLGSVGTPIVSVESGYVECLGWNRYGGWRVGIRSFDKKRYYYYAHLRKNHPYANGLKEGQVVKAGDVIGYLGMTGYSDKENINNMTVPHLHFGMQIIFDESQKDGNNQIWINVYDIVNLLSSNRVRVWKDSTTKDYYREYEYQDLRYKDVFD